ncbi:hypothetical protein [Rhodoferax sp.]|uniref:hypothetical protein n=1 Tax=Rhodoferax sp. TaxID=50421 RepID=UPI0039B8CEFE
MDLDFQIPAILDRFRILYCRFISPIVVPPALFPVGFRKIVLIRSSCRRSATIDASALKKIFDSIGAFRKVELGD